MTGILVTRAEWGARPPRSQSTNIEPGRGGVAWHYEGPHMGTFPHSSCATKVRGIQAFHMDQRGWEDLAYTALPCPHGYIFQGRWLGVRTAAQGTKDGNDRFYAACYLSGANDPLTDDAKRASLVLREMLREQGHAGNEDRPHRFFHATACPGDLLAQWVAAGMPAPGGNPTPVPSPIPPGPYLPEDDMTPQPIKVKLDGQGNGFADLHPPFTTQTITNDRVVSVRFNSQDPPTQGYGRIPTWASRDEGGFARIVIEGGAPNNTYDATVWVTGKL